MKKFLLYTIIFISLFLGTATCVVLNGYNNYLNQATTETPLTKEEDLVLANLTSSVLNSESLSGTISLTDSNKATNITGEIYIENKNSIKANLNLNGKLNDQNVNISLVLIEEQIFINYNEYKLVINSNDLLTAFNSIITSINSSTSTNATTINLSNLTSLLENIQITDYGTGKCITLSIPSFCDAYVITDENYQLKQIMVTNLHLGDNSYTLNINFNANQQQIPIITPGEYLNLGPAINYLSPILNTINQGQLEFNGQINLKDIKLNFKAHLLQDKICGTVSFEKASLNFEYDGEFLIIELYENVFKLSNEEILSLLNNLNISLNKDLNYLLKNIRIRPTIKNNIISNCVISCDDASANFTVSKNSTIPNNIDSSNAKSYNDLNKLFQSYKNLISKNYSINISVQYDDISVSGRAYLELAEEFNSINRLFFEGFVNNIQTKVVHTNLETFVNINENKFKLSNTSLNEVLKIIFNYLGVDTTKLSNIDIDLSLLKNIKINGNSISFNSNETTLTLNSVSNYYNLNAEFKNLVINAKIVPSSKAYSSIGNINQTEYKDFNNLPGLLTALTNTLNKQTLHYSGKINIKLSDFTYKNIDIDIKANLKNNSIEIILDNLPTDAITTYLYNTQYSNQKCKITIINDNISIYTTATHRLTNQTFCFANKTLKLNEFSIDNLYDIMSLRKSVISKIKNNMNGEFLTNLSTDCINLLKTHTKIDLSKNTPEFIKTLTVQFNYKTIIESMQASINVADMLYFEINLKSVN